MVYGKYLKNRTPYNEFKFKTFRNRLASLLKVSKRNYYQNIFTNNSSNLKNIWSGIKELINLKKKSTRNVPTKLKEGDFDITNIKEIANKFNNFFHQLDQIWEIL